MAIGYVCMASFGFLAYQIAMLGVDAWRRREYRRAVEVIDARNIRMGLGGIVTKSSLRPDGIREIKAFDLTHVSLIPSASMIMASPPCEPFARGEYSTVVSLTSSRRACSVFPLRRALSDTSPGFQRRPRRCSSLDFERSIMDGDRPSSVEPRGIFGGVSAAEHDAMRRKNFEEGTGRTDWPFP